MLLRRAGRSVRCSYAWYSSVPMIGMMPGVARGLVHVEDAVHVPVVGDADRRLAVRPRRRDDVADPRRTVEHRVLGVHVEMDERLTHSSAG